MWLTGYPSYGIGSTNKRSWQRFTLWLFSEINRPKLFVRSPSGVALPGTGTTTDERRSGNIDKEHSSENLQGKRVKYQIIPS